MIAPRLMVEGVGEISLPLLAGQAEQLIAQAERAPYGRGEQTLVDTRVRRTWQISPARLRLAGKYWQATLEGVLAQVSEGLGLEDPITAQLYKLLICDEGSFFVSHRDTEKVPGMIATLALALPAASSGGELVVRHKDREMRFDLANDDPGQLSFAAFYADCVHEVLPITAGYRAALVYSLRRLGSEALVPADYAAEGTRIAALLRHWCEGKLYPLEHAYTPAELGFERLKGVDRAAATLLASVASAVGCELHLALLSIQESGSAEHTYRRRWGRESDDEFEALEVFDRTEEISEWRRPDGAPVNLGKIPLEEDEASPPNALTDMEPEEHFEEATGNEGASFERTYKRAILTLWPRHSRLAVINRAGPEATLPYLETLASRWTDEAAAEDSPTWLEAHELAGHMLKTWRAPLHWHSIRGHAGYPGPERKRLARFLAALTVLEDRTRVRSALQLVAAHKGHDPGDHAAILGALARFSVPEGPGCSRRSFGAMPPRHSASAAACWPLRLRDRSRGRRDGSAQRPPR